MTDQAIYDKYAEENNLCVWEYVKMRDVIKDSSPYAFYQLNIACKEVFLIPFSNMINKLSVKTIYIITTFSTTFLISCMIYSIIKELTK